MTHDQKTEMQQLAVIARQGSRIADLDMALRLVLYTLEDGNPTDVQRAQLVAYVRNTLGEFQTDGKQNLRLVE